MPFRAPARLLLFAILAVTMIVGACGNDDDGSGDASDTSTVPAPGALGEDSEFPVTIAHAFGETTVDTEPTRIVSLGFTDHDTLLALGVEPIAIRQWYGDYDFVWPWAQDALGTQTPTVIGSGDLNFEEIAALDPDLIIGQYIGLEDADYETLSAIAPTVAQPGDYPAFGAPWQLMARNIGTAVGRADDADALISDVEDRFAAIRDANPDFEGVALAYAGVYGEDQPSFYVETDGSTRMGVLQDLGFVVPDELAALGDDDFYHDISAERLDLVDQDVVLWEPAVIDLLPSVQSNALYQSLAVARDGRDIFMTDPTVAGAMAHATVLSLPIVLDFLEPELARVVAALAD